MQQGRSSAGKGTGESQDPFEAGAWLEGGRTSGAARCQPRALTPPLGPCSSLPNSQQSRVSRCFLTQDRSHRGGRVTTTPPSSLQTSPTPQLGSLLGRVRGMPPPKRLQGSVTHLPPAKGREKLAPPELALLELNLKRVYPSLSGQERRMSWRLGWPQLVPVQLRGRHLPEAGNTHSKPGAEVFLVATAVHPLLCPHHPPGCC